MQTLKCDFNELHENANNKISHERQSWLERTLNQEIGVHVKLGVKTRIAEQMKSFMDKGKPCNIFQSIFKYLCIEKI